MKNREWMIGLIVLLSIIVVALIVFLCVALNGNFKLKKWAKKKSDTIIFDQTYEQLTIEKLEILSIAGDIRFEESIDEKVRVVVYGENSEDLKVDFRDDELRIDYSQFKRKNVFLGFGFYSNDIVIYIPKNYEKEINVEANYGDIQMCGLENAVIRIKEDCGDVVLGKAKDAFVENHYGDIKIAEITNKVEIKSDCGDVKIDSASIMEDSSIINRFGDIKIGKTNEVYIEAKTDLGDVKVNQNSRHANVMLKIENNCGDIKVEN